MASKLTPEQLKLIAQAARAKKSEPQPYELSDYQAELVTTIALLRKAGTPATTSAILDELLAQTGTLHSPSQANTALGVLTSHGLLDVSVVTPPPGTKGKAPKAYALTKLGAAALSARRQRIEEMLEKMRSTGH